MYPSPGVFSPKTQIHQRIAKMINEWHTYCEQWIPPIFQHFASTFSQSFLIQFWKSQCPSYNKCPEFSKTPPTSEFWMILKVVMAIFPRKDIFLGHPVVCSSKVLFFTYYENIYVVTCVQYCWDCWLPARWSYSGAWSSFKQSYCQ